MQWSACESTEPGGISYSQAASRTPYRRRGRQQQQNRRGSSISIPYRYQYQTVFPPLPNGPPPPHAHQSYTIYGQPQFTQTYLYNFHSHQLPTGLLDNTRSSYSPSKQAVCHSNGNKFNPRTEAIDFDKTIVKIFVDWTEHKIDCLPPNVASELGLDLWQYELRKKPPPTSDQEALLRARVLQLAYESPLKLHQAIEKRQLNSILGHGFEWVECPNVW